MWYQCSLSTSRYTFFYLSSSSLSIPCLTLCIRTLHLIPPSSNLFYIPALSNNCISRLSILIRGDIVRPSITELIPDSSCCLLLPVPADDGAPDISLVHHLDYQGMDSLRYGFTNPLRNAAKTIRTLVKDRREYLVGIALLLVVVFLWALSNFVTQVRANPPSSHARLITSLCGAGYLSRGIRETFLVRR